jgi:hypothetical protein
MAAALEPAVDTNALSINSLRSIHNVFFYETSLSSIPIKEEAWTIVHTASTMYKIYIQGPEASSDDVVMVYTK